MLLEYANNKKRYNDNKIKTHKKVDDLWHLITDKIATDGDQTDKEQYRCLLLQ